MGLDLPKDHQIRYLSKREADILAIKNDLGEDNFETAILIGHRLKGSGETFGFPLITTYGGTIEKAGLNKDKTLILETLEKLSQSVKDYQEQMAHS